MAPTLILLAMLLAGCSPSASSDPAPMPDALAQLAEQQITAIEDETRTCMAELGFDYTARRPDDGADALREGDDLRRWVQTHGYGYATRLIDDLDAEYVSGDEVGPDDIADPGYEHALYGDADHPGCAQTSMARVQERYDLTPLNEVEDRLGAQRRRMVADRRYVVAQEDWSTCMADAGFVGHVDFGDADEASMAAANDMSRDLNRALEAAFDERSSDIPDGGERIASRDLLPSSLRRAIAELAAEEIARAVTDFDCRSALADELEALRADYLNDLERERAAVAREITRG